MYAIIKTGGKQYRVSEGQTLKVESLAAEPDEEINFTEILHISDGERQYVGTPTLQNAIVKAEVMNHGRARKINIIKFKRRKHHMKRQGHRQNYTEVKITGIELGAQSQKEE